MSVETILVPCPDCNRYISPNAETCPLCGRPLLYRDITVTPGARWSWTVCWGIFLAWLVSLALAVAVGLILFVLSVLWLALMAGKQ